MAHVQHQASIVLLEFQPQRGLVQRMPPEVDPPAGNCHMPERRAFLQNVGDIEVAMIHLHPFMPAPREHARRGQAVPHDHPPREREHKPIRRRLQRHRVSARRR